MLHTISIPHGFKQWLSAFWAALVLTLVACGPASPTETQAPPDCQVPDAGQIEGPGPDAGVIVDPRADYEGIWKLPATLTVDGSQTDSGDTFTITSTLTANQLSLTDSRGCQTTAELLSDNTLKVAAVTCAAVVDPNGCSAAFQNNEGTASLGPAQGTRGPVLTMQRTGSMTTSCDGAVQTTAFTIVYVGQHR